MAVIIFVGIVYIGVIIIVFLFNRNRQKSIVPLPVVIPEQKIININEQPASRQKEEKAVPFEPEIEYAPKAEKGPLLM